VYLCMYVCSHCSHSCVDLQKIERNLESCERSAEVLKCFSIPRSEGQRSEGQRFRIFSLT